MNEADQENLKLYVLQKCDFECRSKYRYSYIVLLGFEIFKVQIFVAIRIAEDILCKRN